MIRHIDMFTRGAADAEARACLDPLVGVVAGLQTVTFEPDLGLTEAGYRSVAHVSEHHHNAALEAYTAHPAHQEAGAFIRSFTDHCATVSFELR